MRAAAPPEFGVSHHLASTLLKAVLAFPDRRAVINIRYDETIGEALARRGIPFVEQDRTRFRDVAGFVGSGAWGGERVIVDPGDFGIEPLPDAPGPAADPGVSLRLRFELPPGSYATVLLESLLGVDVDGSGGLGIW